MVRKDDFVVLNGNSIDVLKTLPDKSVQCCVTSPPYYGLRDYGTGTWVGGDPNCPHYRTSKYSENDITGHKAMCEEGQAVGDAIYKSVCPLCGATRVDEQIGIEETPEEYIERLVEVFREVKRVLKDDGTLWVNIGDTYNTNSYHKTKESNGYGKQGTNRGSYENTVDRPTAKCCKPKDLIGIPWLLAFALRNDGWYLRNDIVWCLSSGQYLYAKTQKGVMPITVRDLSRLPIGKFELWDGKEWVKVKRIEKSCFYNQKIRIVLRSGERISCTDGHRWVLADGSEKIASELRVGDILKTCSLPDSGSHSPGFLTNDVLWLLGLYLAEGSKSGDCIQLSLNKDEFKWYDRIDNTVKYLGGTSTYTIDGNMLNVRVYSQVLSATIHQYIGGTSAKNKHLNNICWGLSNNCLKELIHGYFDGDGCADTQCDRIRLGFTRNYYLERDLRVLASRLGATLTLNTSVSKIGDKAYKSFKGEWRWSRSGHFNEKDRAQIVRIETSNSRGFYDIEVDSVSHTFCLASGVLTHNCKKNPMPSPVKDRFTNSHEYIFLFSKSSRYLFNHEAVQEDSICADDRRHGEGRILYSGKRLDGTDDHAQQSFVQITDKRNKRDVWSVSVNSYKEAHFATYPEELILPCILAGSNEGDTVLDPFNGSGTTGICAIRNGRKYTGIDLNKEYIDLSYARFDETFFRKKTITEKTCESGGLRKVDLLGG